MNFSTISRCLFPAAGYGTRFLPASKSVPKEMLPVLNKPLIHYGVEEALEAGMCNICIVYGRHKDALINYFDLNVELEQHIAATPAESLLKPVNHLMRQCTFSFTRQRCMRGLGDAILTGEYLVQQEPFAVLLADDLCFGKDVSPLQQMQQVYRQHGKSVVLVAEVAVEQISNYGVVTVADPASEVMRVTSLVEKPRTGQVASNLAIIGRYLLTPDIFAILRNVGADANGEIQITDALNVQAQHGALLAVRFTGRRFDCGRVAGMVAATNYLYQKTL